MAAVADLDTGAGGIVEEPVGVDGLVWGKLVGVSVDAVGAGFGLDQDGGAAAAELGGEGVREDDEFFDSGDVDVLLGYAFGGGVVVVDAEIGAGRLEAGHHLHGGTKMSGGEGAIFDGLFIEGGALFAARQFDAGGVGFDGKGGRDGDGAEFEVGDAGGGEFDLGVLLNGAEAGGFTGVEREEGQEIVAGLVGGRLAEGAGFGIAGGEFDAGDGGAGGVDGVAFELAGDGLSGEGDRKE